MGRADGDVQLGMCLILEKKVSAEEVTSIKLWGLANDSPEMIQEVSYVSKGSRVGTGRGFPSPHQILRTNSHSSSKELGEYDSFRN